MKFANANKLDRKIRGNVGHPSGSYWVLLGD